MRALRREGFYSSCDILLLVVVVFVASALSELDEAGNTRSHNGKVDSPGPYPAAGRWAPIAPTCSALCFETMSIMDEMDHKRTDVKAWRHQWKARLKEVCLQRVRRERNKLLWDVRLAGAPTAATTTTDEFAGSAFEHIVADELQKVKHDSGVFQESELPDAHAVGMEEKDIHDMLWEHETPDVPTELEGKEYEALMLAMEHALYEDMYAELEGRDAALMEEYETVHTLEDESLAAVVEHWQEHEEGGLLCPLCRTRRLQQSQRSIFCGCGRFQIDTQSDQVGLDFLQKRLAEVLQEHIDSGCRGQGIFSIQRRFGIGALYMQCSVCDTFQLVL